MKKNNAIIILLIVILALVGITYMDIWGTDAQGSGSASEIKLGLDLAGGVSITYQVVGDEAPSATDMSDTIAKLQQRVENYSTEAIVYQEGLDRINVEIPGVKDANAILQELGKPGALYFIHQTDEEGNENYSYTGSGYVLNKTLEELQEEGSIPLTGTDVKAAEARSGQDQQTKNPEFVVSLDMTEEGTQKFADATKRAYEKGETLAIYYDGNFVSVPRVQAILTNGQASITGMDSFDEAEKLASTIRIGGLKLELEELHSKVVGAQLGIEAISTSLKAGLIGFAIVIVFMLLVYFVAGFAASLSLALYTAVVVMLLLGFDMTLTLSGIAGIILSIGMAVDANVVILARIREELGTGKTVKSAIDIGYAKAMSAIVDGNVTTLIAAAVLLFMAPGSIRGFAQTLALGIVISMFTALVVCKYIMKALYALGFKSEKLYGVGKERKPIDFVSKRYAFIGLSVAVIISGIVAMGVYGEKTLFGIRMTV